LVKSAFVVARFGCVAGLVVGVGSLVAQRPETKIAIDTGSIAEPASAGIYGLMTEEINHSYEGGLYAELLSNGTFKGSWDGVQNWKLVQRGQAVASMNVDNSTGPSEALPTSMKLTVEKAEPGDFAGVSNDGYWGIPLKPHTGYHGSLYAKSDLSTILPLRVQLINDDSGAVVATSSVGVSPGAWQRYEYTLKAEDVIASTHNHIEFTVPRKATLWLQLVKLMPPTFEGKENGNRIDLMEKMAAMHPHFLRLPGGNAVEGDRLEDWYNWKKTIGPLVDRPGHQPPWGYWSTDDFGFLEYLEWTEQLKIEPVLAVYAGYALRGDHIKVGKDLEPFVESALDEVEYVTGDVNTKWGAERAKDGHPAPFPLHYIEIGNEDNFDKSGSYDERFAQFALALRKKYPQYKLIATTPVKEKEGAEPDLIDDHYYKSSADMFDLVKHYDDAPRTGPKVFVGEWATRSGSPTPNFGDALGDAAFMTSMERNSDLILMASYAPLFVNVNPGAMQWSSDLIGYDALHSYGSPSWYAQCMFGASMGDVVPKSEVENAGERFFYSATVSSETHVLHLKLVNATDKAMPLSVMLTGIGAGAHVAKTKSLHGASYEATNSITEPEFIKPVEGTLRFTGKEMKETLPALTIEVVDVPLK
jgi:alpha-N-arabinofuranosidase